MANRTDTYKDAAAEYATILEQLHLESRFVLTHYLSGLAVECMLLAYKFRRDPHFDPNHRLAVLAKDAGFFDFVSQGSRDELRAALHILVERWDNAHRYRSQSALRTFLAQRALDRRVSGDRLKYSSRLMVNAAVWIVAEGNIRWPRN